MTEIKICNVCNVPKELSCFSFRKELGKYRKHCNKCKPLKKEDKPPRTHKICKDCNAEKPVTEFNPSGKISLSARCKPCDTNKRHSIINADREGYLQLRKEKYNKNKEKIALQNKLYIQKNILVIKERTLEYKKRNKEKIKKAGTEYYLKNKEIIRLKLKIKYDENRDNIIMRQRYLRANRTLEQKQKEKEYRERYYKENEEKVKEKSKLSRVNGRAKRKEYRDHRRKNDVDYKIRENLRTRIRGALRGNQKSQKTESLLGCTINFFREHFKNQFSIDMTWEKFLNSEIHIDHIKPCASFDLSIDSEQHKCFHYTNLQPLWAIDNLKKGAKLNYKIQYAQCFIQ